MTDQPTSPALARGRYRHFKGGEYRVLDLARDADSGEWLVIYRALYGECGLWIRPLARFDEIIDRNGVQVRRFEFIGD